MSNLVSIIVAIVAFLVMILGLIPGLGWLNWGVAVLCIVGIIFGAVSERKKSGLTINAAVLAVGMLRLLLGGGIL